MILQRVPGLPETEEAVVNELLDVLSRKAERNRLRAAYYDAKSVVPILNDSIPPSMRRLHTVLGWPAKAVDTLNVRCHVDRMFWPDGPQDLVDRVWADNWLGQEMAGWQTSALVHAVSWVITSRGDTRAGEPNVLMMAADALEGAAWWDPRRRAIAAFLKIDEQSNGQVPTPTEMTLFTPSSVFQLVKTKGEWRAAERRHGLGYVPVEPLRFRPRLGRPFGSSRITRPVMRITDLAARTVLRSEISGEFYSMPPRIVLNASEEAFTDGNGNPTDAWRLVFGRFLALESTDDGGPDVDIKQLPQGSQQPHMDQLRSLSYLFAGETSIPPESLGFRTDSNPASEGAYFAAREDLITLAESTINDWSRTYERAMLTAVQIDTGADERPNPDGLRAGFRDPRYTSRSQAADAMVKNAQVFPWLAESDTAVELMGYDDVTTDRLLADKRKAEARGTLSLLEDLDRGDTNAGS